MAKMFYSMEEAAEQLGVSTDDLKQMAEDGKLQQFRDRDKVMFKREQVDKLAGAGSAAAADTSDAETQGEDTDDMDAITLEDTGESSTASTGDAGGAGQATGEPTDQPAEAGDDDVITLADESPDDDSDTQSAPTDKPRAPSGEGRKHDDAGISVFDSEEVDTADPAAQTVVSSAMDDKSGSDDDELALESVGSGSGLLDLTREADDTSLGAELLDEIYPGGGSDAKMDSQAGGTQFGDIFGAGGEDSAPSGAADIEGEAGAEPAGPAPIGAQVAAAEPFDPVGSGWAGGLLIGAFVAFIFALMALTGAMAGTTVALTTAFAGNPLMWIGILAGGTLVLAIVGGLIGKAIDR